jgi:23S rRNA pseudouridine1911/1915/1917 synthase
VILTYTAREEDAGRKVYSVLRREMRISQSLARRLKRCGAIYVGGEAVFTDYILAPSDVVRVDVTAGEEPSGNVPERGEIEILFENAGLLAVNKPAGVITHPSFARYTGTLANFVTGCLRDKGEGETCHAVNRLDRDTSGVVLFAKNGYMKALASEALMQNDARKEYCALVYGAPEPLSGTVDKPIKRQRERDMLRITAEDGQRAVTHYETLGVYQFEKRRVSLLRLQLETGRTHQIRVHALALGSPILGDGLYYTDASREASSELGIATQALHAVRLCFTEPLSGKPIEIVAPEPPVFQEVLQKTKKVWPDTAR